MKVESTRKLWVFQAMRRGRRIIHSKDEIVEVSLSQRELRTSQWPLQANARV